MKRVRLGIDIDSVLCDTMPRLLEKINREHGTAITMEDAIQWDFPVGDTTFDTLILKAFRDPVLLMSLPPMQGSQEAVKRLVNDFDLVVVTSRKELTVDATRLWVETHFGPLLVVHTGDSKNGHDLDILVDDAPHNVTPFAETGRPAILFDQPWNQKVEPHPFIWRCKNWPHVYRSLYAHALPAALSKQE